MFLVIFLLYRTIIAITNYDQTDLSQLAIATATTEGLAALYYSSPQTNLNF
ncbi:MAG: hypothetical protein AAGA80_10915 [Cyanobacteria bacterium P01_F01_bin.143]